MKPHDLETYLVKKIPLAKFMRVSVVSVKPDTLVLAAPLEPNANGHQTLFVGSAASIALSAAWPLRLTRMNDQ